MDFNVYVVTCSNGNKTTPVPATNRLGYENSGFWDMKD